MTPQQAVATQIFGILTGPQGPKLSLIDACGIIASIQAESAFNPKALGDYQRQKRKRIPRAHGLCQWWPDRCAAIKAGCGVDILTLPPVADQITGLLWELQHTEVHSYAILKTSQTAFQAGYNFCKYFERPADPAQWNVRGHLAEQWATFFAPTKSAPK